MIDLRLSRDYRLDEESYDDLGTVKPYWQFMDETMNTHDLDLRIIRHLYKVKCSFSRLKQFVLEPYVVLVLDTEIIIYRLEDSFDVYSRGDMTKTGLLNIVLSEIDISEGISLEGHYDLINNNILFQKQQMSLKDLYMITERICLKSQQDVTLQTGEVVHLSYAGDTCKIGKSKISTIDIMIFNFLFKTKTNLLNLKIFTIEDYTFVLAGDYIIRYSCIQDIDYMCISQVGIDEVLSFLCNLPEKVKTPKSTKKKLHISNNLMQKILYLIKKP